jgi:hypothetical protein
VEIALEHIIDVAPRVELERHNRQFDNAIFLRIEPPSGCAQGANETLVALRSRLLLSTIIKRLSLRANAMLHNV